MLAEFFFIDQKYVSAAIAMKKANFLLPWTPPGR
jgi:hypothetical protein